MNGAEWRHYQRNLAAARVLVKHVVPVPSLAGFGISEGNMKKP